jgi:1-acyl-sn-glycerol-3-phosphate acyltransferase
VAALEQGELLGIFPEGTIAYGGSMPHTKPGTALLALKTGLPVVPLGVQGSLEAFPAWAKIPRSHPIRLHLGSPVTYPKRPCVHIPDEQVTKVREDIRRRILHVMAGMPFLSSPLPIKGGISVRMRTVLAAVVIIPLARFLTSTANPSLDPVART